MNKKIRMMIDTLMVVLLPVLMAYSLVGELLHEVAGTLMFFLFIAHHIVNRKWFGSILKGRYNLRRIIMTIVNLLLLIIMILLPVSGIMMSKHLYTFIPYLGVTFYARTLHMVTAYWGFVLMCVHLGLHMNVMLQAANRHPQKTDAKKMNIKKVKLRKYVITVIAAVISGYGVYAFQKRNLTTYLFMKNQFVMFNFYEAKIYFFIDYIAMMVMITTITYFLTATIAKIGIDKNKDKNKPLQ